MKCGLQLDIDLMLEKAIIHARQKETIRKQQKYRGVPKDKGKKSVTVPSQKKCDRFLGNNHARRDCSAKDAICHACEKRGHHRKARISKHIGQVTVYTDRVREATDQVEELFLGVIESPNQETAWESKVFINNKNVSIKLDSGAVREILVGVLHVAYCSNK